MPILKSRLRATLFDPHPEPCALHQKERTLQEVADIIGVTRRAVSFIEDRALVKLWKLAEDPQLRALFEREFGT